jgi:enoyl-CoA hydratase/carnithine racemase
VTPADARAMGLVNWVCPATEVDATVARLLERLRHQAPTANAHIKRLLNESFHRDPRASIEDVMAAQRDCMESWEAAEANRAWHDKREVVFSPRPSTTLPSRTSNRPPTS